jgi:rRNA biogenesis protein RRP5
VINNISSDVDETTEKKLPKKIIQMPDFPRGGKQELSALEYREISEKAEKDLFAEELAPSKKRKGKSVVEEIVKKPKNEFVAMLTWKRLLAGTTILGIVKEISELEIVVSLPNQLQGYVSITEISSLITEKVTAVANASASDNEDETMEEEVNFCPKNRKNCRL